MTHPKLRLTLPWEAIDEQARRQILQILELPELERLAVMPDAHAGYDMCIGGVALMRGVVSPSFVGYDIGCGMCCVDAGLSLRDLGLAKPKDLENFFAKLRQVVPAGLGKGGGASSGIAFRSATGDKKLDKIVAPSAATQLGTLGSGNHFLEIGVNDAGRTGVTIHSGSRRAGYDIAAWHMAKGRLLPLESAAGRAYVADMNWALDFAQENRRLMLQATLEAMGFSARDVARMLSPETMINETHNHAVPYGKGLMLHRKGATPAEKGRLGVIPANQRDGVWVTRGLGNEEFLCSASHGAGRVLSRKAAAKKGSETDLKRLMKGVICRTDKGVLDEAPWAYKDIKTVLAAQDGLLVEITDRFKPVLVLKG